jgi:transposase-like protein
MILICPICSHESVVMNSPIVKCSNCLRTFQLEDEMLQEIVPIMPDEFNKLLDRTCVALTINGKGRYVLRRALENAFHLGSSKIFRRSPIA